MFSVPDGEMPPELLEIDFFSEGNLSRTLGQSSDISGHSRPTNEMDANRAFSPLPFDHEFNMPEAIEQPEIEMTNKKKRKSRSKFQEVSVSFPFFDLTEVNQQKLVCLFPSSILQK